MIRVSLKVDPRQTGWVVDTADCALVVQWEGSGFLEHCAIDELVAAPAWWEGCPNTTGCCRGDSADCLHEYLTSVKVRQP